MKVKCFDQKIYDHHCTDSKTLNGKLSRSDCENCDRDGFNFTDFQQLIRRKKQMRDRNLPVATFEPETASLMSEKGIYRILQRHDWKDYDKT